MPGYNPKHRRAAREMALQAVYQWNIAGGNLADIDNQYCSYKASDVSEKVDVDYFSMLLRGVVQMQTNLDFIFSPCLDRDITTITPIELAILRIGTYELLECPEVPDKVIINEAVAIARRFGAEKSYKFINGVLHQTAIAVSGAKSEVIE